MAGYYRRLSFLPIEFYLEFGHSVGQTGGMHALQRRNRPWPMSMSGARNCSEKGTSSAVNLPLRGSRTLMFSSDSFRLDVSSIRRRLL